MRAAFIRGLIKSARKDNRIMLITGDLGFRFLEPFANNFPDRFINIGVAEANLVTVAAGLASVGWKPFIYSIATFASMRAFEQIRTDIVMQKLNVKIVGIGAGLAYNKAGPTHHSMEDIALMRLLPGMDIVAPVDVNETEAVTQVLSSTNNPAYLRLEKNPAESIHPQIPEFKLGTGYSISKNGSPDKKSTLQSTTSRIATQSIAGGLRGDSIALLVTGTKVGTGIKVAGLLNDKLKKVDLYAFPTINPLDKKLLDKIIIKNQIIITIEEHRISGGFGTAVGEYIQERNYKNKLVKIGLNDVITSISAEYDRLLSYHHMLPRQIANRILSEL
jgi:transketolase